MMLHSAHQNEGMLEKQAELAFLMGKDIREDGIHETKISKLKFIRNSQPTMPIHLVHQPALCIIAQGKKIVILGEESYYYDASDYLVISVDLPISGQVIEASSEAPYLCLLFELDLSLVLDVMKESELSMTKSKESLRGLYVSKTNETLLDAVIRLIRLMDSPQDMKVLAPMVTREIMYRILNGSQGELLKQIAMTGSNTNRVAAVIQQLKKEYDKPLRIEELAAFANMSSASLHRHFREVTAMSPLQYQKQIRLQEARRLLLSESADAAEVGFRVGYESPSQFSREYSRLFGLPPISDMKRLRLLPDQQSV